MLRFAFSKESCRSLSLGLCLCALGLALDLLDDRLESESTTSIPLPLSFIVSLPLLPLPLILLLVPLPVPLAVPLFIALEFEVSTGCVSAIPFFLDGSRGPVFGKRPSSENLSVEDLESLPRSLSDRVMCFLLLGLRNEPLSRSLMVLVSLSLPLPLAVDPKLSVHVDTEVAIPFDIEVLNGDNLLFMRSVVRESLTSSDSEFSNSDDSVIPTSDEVVSLISVSDRIRVEATEPSHSIESDASFDLAILISIASKHAASADISGSGALTSPDVDSSTMLL